MTSATATTFSGDLAYGPRTYSGLALTDIPQMRLAPGADWGNVTFGNEDNPAANGLVAGGLNVPLDSAAAAPVFTITDDNGQVIGVEAILGHGSLIEEFTLQQMQALDVSGEVITPSNAQFEAAARHDASSHVRAVVRAYREAYDTAYDAYVTNDNSLPAPLVANPTIHDVVEVIADGLDRPGSTATGTGSLTFGAAHTTGVGEPVDVRVPAGRYALVTWTEPQTTNSPVLRVGAYRLPD